MNQGRQSLKEPLLVENRYSDDAIISERNEDIHRITKDLRDLKEAMNDVSVLVGDQGNDIDQIDQNVAHADVSTEEARKELKKASEYQASRRKKILIITLIIVVVVFVVIMIVLWQTGVI
eukprot:TRINITY_DN11726_c0_g1_i1.p1 TRINITY_DN11726_c0_g1~~TRINITY_DN11726_c0_g1_i1.p1  ORF type:complete len:120 (+),score=20.73 TRINITY_DN11726_c0_g1_i1:33-392(+)